MTKCPLILNDEEKFIRFNHLLCKKIFFYLAHSLLSSISGSKGDKCVASVEAGHGVHHEPEIPNGATFFKQWYQLTLVHVARNFATKDLWKRNKKYSSCLSPIRSKERLTVHSLKLTFFRKCELFVKSPKKIFQITILKLKFEFPAHNSKQLIQILSAG